MRQNFFILATALLLASLALLSSAVMSEPIGSTTIEPLIKEQSLQQVHELHRVDRNNQTSGAQEEEEYIDIEPSEFAMSDSDETHDPDANYEGDDDLIVGPIKTPQRDLLARPPKIEGN